MIKIKRLVSFILSILTLSSLIALFSTSAYAVDMPAIANVEGAYVYNFENNRVIFEDNSTKKVFPTSTVKIMTAILAFEALEGRLDEQITITREMLSAVAGNNIGLAAGEVVTVNDMLWSMLVNGANDCAYVLAYTVSGNVQDFIARMNTRAKELGALNTIFTNPSGMHDAAMYTTTADIAAIARHAYTIPQFMECASSVKYVMAQTNLSGQRTLYNRNCLLTVYYEKSYYNAEAKGMNAGSTKEGGHCVVTTVSKNDLTYLIVVMGGQTVDNKLCSYTAVNDLIKWAYTAYTYDEVLSPSQIICEVPVTLSSVTDYVSLVAADTLNVFLPSDVDTASEITLSWVTFNEVLQAPVKKDQVVGSVTAIYNDQILGSSDLIATADVSRSEMLYTFYKIEQFSKSRFFIATIVAAVIFTIIYIFGNAFLRGRRINKRHRY